ncbi:MAG: RNA-directed DNA polymerase [Pseudomonadota bacterium]
MTAGLARVADFANLLLAHRRCQRRKHLRPDVLRLSFDLEKELLELREQLRDRSYRPGPYRTFTVHEPKTRTIHAAPYRDRVVHHALCQIIEPLLERSLIFDTYACRRGKGTHRALARCGWLCRRFAFAARCDVEKYFPAVDHQILLEDLERRIRDPGILWLCEAILAGGRIAAGPARWFPGDDLLTPLSRPRGLPIGNLTSQLFANAYLDPVDHFIKEKLRLPGYLRYLDDMLLFASSPALLAEAVAAVEERLYSLRLRLHRRQAVPQATHTGVGFLGFRLFASARPRPGQPAREHHRLLKGASKRRTTKRLRRLEAAFARGETTVEHVSASIQATLAHFDHGDTGGLRRAILARFVL